MGVFEDLANERILSSDDLSLDTWPPLDRINPCWVRAPKPAGRPDELSKKYFGIK